MPGAWCVTEKVEFCAESRNRNRSKQLDVASVPFHVGESLVASQAASKYLS